MLVVGKDWYCWCTNGQLLQFL